MKVKVTAVFFDNNGVHSVGEIVETEVFDGRRMEMVEKPVEKTETKRATKKVKE